MRRLTYSKYFTAKPKRRRTLALEMSMASIASAMLILLLFSVWFAIESKTYAESLPENTVIKNKITDSSQNSYVYDRNGELLYIFSDPNQDRDYVALAEIPDSVKWATIVSEDENFFEHNGLDYIGLARAIAITVGSGGETVVGGSTITQQLVKNSVLTNERTLDRKIREVLISFYVEQEFTKDEILELYLNSASFGGRVKGVKAASRVYLGKELNDLTLDESVFLISLIQTPGKSSPLFSQNQDKAWEIVNARSDYIKSQLQNNIEQIENDVLVKQIDNIKFPSKNIELNPTVGQIKAPHFVFYVRDQILTGNYGVTEDDLYMSGLQIYTTLDLEIQELAEKKLKEGVDISAYYGVGNGGMVVLNPENGELLAMVGSKDYFGERSEDGRFDPEVNVTLSKRNVGSTLKPLITYIAVDYGFYGPWSGVNDKPVNFYGYSPKNYDGQFKGWMTITDALRQSRNTPFVQVLNQIGVQNMLDLMKELGYSDLDDNFYGLSMAVGGYGTTLLQHTHSYSAFANQGNLANLNVIQKIENSEQSVLFKANYDQKEILNVNHVNTINSMLLDYGPAGIAGKTGTTDRNKDTYFIGYNNKLIAGIWMGNNNNIQMDRYSFGSTTALPTWERFYFELIKVRPEFESKILNTLPPRPIIKTETEDTENEETTEQSE